jgi:hypothetical protein
MMTNKRLFECLWKPSEIYWKIMNHHKDNNNKKKKKEEGYIQVKRKKSRAE